MARYFFDWRDGDNFDEDVEGMELPDLEAAKIEASRSLLAPPGGELSHAYACARHSAQLRAPIAFYRGPG